MYVAPDVIERCDTPRGEIQLQRRGHHYEIISNGTFLMSTYNGESERLLVKAALDNISSARRVLIGGLGTGFSLDEALTDERVESVTVVEIENKIIEWNQSHLAPFSNHGLADERTHIVHADLVDWVHKNNDEYDAICLDIDNGPDWMVTESNAGLYEGNGLSALTELLAPDGTLAFWSAAASSSFANRLNAYFHHVVELDVPQSHGEPDYVYLASEPVAL